MPEDFSIEELIVDDSFINYCFQSNEDDILFWREYIRSNPSQKKSVTEAMQLVLGLRTMLQADTRHHPTKPLSTSNVILGPPRTTIIKKIILTAASVAAVLLLVFGIKGYLSPGAASPHQLENIAAKVAADNELLFHTEKGQKKSIVLPDSTKVFLGAGSSLRIAKGFGKSNRDVHLRGEALFDVTHNEDLSFFVHSDKFYVKVLGTLFNVRAYPEDLLSETALIRGKVEISLKNNAQKITLRPSQKAVITSQAESLVLKSRPTDSSQIRQKISILPLSYNSEDSAVVETAWVRNRLEIVNESFTEVKSKLERWYNVKIVFVDDAVSNYTFTGTFTEETIEQVLTALRYSYHFTYKRQGASIFISK